jgi:hypothetical protein
VITFLWISWRGIQYRFISPDGVMSVTSAIDPVPKTSNEGFAPCRLLIQGGCEPSIYFSMEGSDFTSGFKTRYHAPQSSVSGSRSHLLARRRTGACSCSQSRQVRIWTLQRFARMLLQRAAPKSEANDASCPQNRPTSPQNCQMASKSDHRVMSCRRCLIPEIAYS